MRPFESSPVNPTNKGPLPESADEYLLLIQTADDWEAWMAEETKRQSFLYPPSDN
jgi:hypothetical protein